MTIVLGYDDSPGAGAALTTAVGIAARLGEPLVLVYGAGVPGGMGEEFRAHREALHEMGRTALDHAVAQAQGAGVPTTVELVDDKPADALVAVAERHDASVIVVGTAGESPLRGAMLGSTPHKLLQLSDRPVLCVPAPVERG
jgi:nucleotide-binding universal stress UspA family protein